LSFIFKDGKNLVLLDKAGARFLNAQGNHVVVIDEVA